MSVRSLLVSTLALLVLSSPLSAQEEMNDRVTTRIDWDARLLRVTIERPVDAVSDPGPTAISRTQRSIRTDAPSILASVLSDIRFNSLETVGTLISQHEELISSLEQAAQSARALDARASADLRHAQITFAVDLYRDLGTHFVSHSSALPIESRLGWVPHIDYTGIIIYAADTLPLFGTDTTVRTEAALFPGLYYLQSGPGLLHRLAELPHFAPSQLRDGGPVAYTADVQATSASERVGTRPLRILAVATFGENPTDIVISEEDAKQIMASEHNRDLLRSGRVALVLHPDQL